MENNWAGKHEEPNTPADKIKERTIAILVAIIMSTIVLFIITVVIFFILWMMEIIHPFGGVACG